MADQPASRAHASSGRKWRIEGAFSLSSCPSVPKTAPFLPREATVKSRRSTNRVVLVRANLCVTHIDYTARNALKIGKQTTHGLV